jgi:ABC-type lipoprotein export system ATPase subunit
MEEPMYKLTGVVKDYRRGAAVVSALGGVDLVIEDGEWLAIQGPTGHGKSTLLQIIGGLDRPTSGTVELDGIIGLLETQWRLRGLTMVLVTHESAVAARAQRVATMRDGGLTVTRAASRPPASRAGG